MWYRPGSPGHFGVKRLGTGLLFIVLWMGAVLPCRGQDSTGPYHFGSFRDAVSASVDPFGTVYVTDADRHMILALSMSGRILHQSGGQGWTSSSLDEPMGVDARLGIAIYVADQRNHRIVRLDQQLTVTAVLSTRDNPSAQENFGAPRDIASDPLGGLYILDGENMRIVRSAGFDRVEFAFGGSEAGPARLTAALALDVAGTGTVCVLEPARIATYDSFGQWRGDIGRGQLQDATALCCGAHLMYAATRDSLHAFGYDGQDQGTISLTSLPGWTDGDSVRDLAEYRDSLLILTASTIILVPHPAFQKP